MLIKTNDYVLYKDKIWMVSGRASIDMVRVRNENGEVETVAERSIYKLTPELGQQMADELNKLKQEKAAIEKDVKDIWTELPQIADELAILEEQKELATKGITRLSNIIRESYTLMLGKGIAKQMPAGIGTWKLVPKYIYNPIEMKRHLAKVRPDLLKYTESAVDEYLEKMNEEGRLDEIGVELSEEYKITVKRE